MGRTAGEIRGYFRELLKGSGLIGAVTGGLYFGGTRPRDSRVEDVTVMWSGGVTGEVESGTVTINIAVADMDPYKDGVLVEDIGRTDLLSRLASEWVEKVEGEEMEYLLSQKEPVHTIWDYERGEHLVVVRIDYRRLNEGE